MSTRIPKIRTGIGALDVALGGGIPLGGCSMIWGPPKHGKTTLVGNIIASFQRYYPGQEIIYIETEDKYDEEYFESIGVKMDKTFVRKQDVFYLGEVLDFVLAVLRDIEDWPDVGLIVVDSLGALAHKKRIEKESDVLMIPPEANTLAGTMQQYVTEQRRRRYLKKLVTTLFTTHALDRMPTSPVGHTYSVPAGGKRLQYVTGSRIQVRKPEYKDAQTLGGIKRSLRVEIPFTISASLGGQTDDRGEFNIFQMDSPPFRTGQPDDLQFWWHWGLETGWIKGGGKAYRLGEREEPYAGKVGVLDYWRKNLDQYRKDQDEMLPLVIQLRKVRESYDSATTAPPSE